MVEVILGFETVARTVHNMREAAMGGSFTSPFNSASKLEKIVHSLPDNVCDSIEVRFAVNS